MIGFEQADSEGSKQFQKIREEENKRKRSEAALHILKQEKEYVESLGVIVQVCYDSLPLMTFQYFLIPLREAASTPNTLIIPMNDIVDIFSNIEPIYKTHSEYIDLTPHC